MNTVAEAVAILLQLTTTLAQAAANVQTISSLIQQAQATGSATFTDAQWAQIQAIDTNARNTLIAQIAAALQK